MEALIFSKIDFTIFFYNPNIHPLKEYELRKEENIRFAEKHNIPFINANYDKNNWFQRAKGMENEPEHGIRCSMCFDMRLERTSLICLTECHCCAYNPLNNSLSKIAITQLYIKYRYTQLA